MFTTEKWEMIAAFDNIDGPVLIENSEGIIVNAKRDLASGNVVAFSESGYEEMTNFEYMKVDLPEIARAYDDFGRTISGANL